MSTLNRYQDWARQVRKLFQALGRLESLAAPLGVAGLSGREWYGSLKHKLLAQLEGDPFLVVAVVGGTNIGKSVLFNHLANDSTSAVSPLASGTKHPVCLAPRGFTERPEVDLNRLFEGFRLCEWKSRDDAFRDAPEHLMFWRESGQIPSRLLLLDTPDIDSDAEVNWERADLIRHAADVLVAVLTQQKYNDAAVKRFFRAAVEADKAIVVVFNQCELPEDDAYWPRWLETFCEATGAEPKLVYVAPYDRRAADENRLPVWRVTKPAARGEQQERDHVASSTAHAPLAAPSAAIGSSNRAANTAGGTSRGTRVAGAMAGMSNDAANTVGGASRGTPALRDDLADLQFEAIKLRTLRGALMQVLDEDNGVPGYLREVAAAGAHFREAWRVLSSTDLARITWPALPTSLVVDEVRRWWHERRGPIPRRLHGFYSALGRGVLWPARQTASRLRGEPADPLVEFQRRERACVLEAIEQLLGELERLSRVGNDVLRHRLQRALSGRSRKELLDRLRAEHEALPVVDEQLRALISAELDRVSRANPRAVRALRSLDWALALSRPAITVTLAVSGWALAGHAVSHAAADAAWQSIGHAAGHTTGQLLAEVAVTGGVAGSGEAVVEGTGHGLKLAAARVFGRFNEHYARRRAAWLSEFVDRELLAPVLGELRDGAQVVESEPFQRAEGAIVELRRLASGRANDYG